MIIFLGILLWVALNAWLTLYALIATFPTWGESVMAGGFWSKSLGIALWIIALCSWFWMFSSIDIKVAV